MSQCAACDTAYQQSVCTSSVCALPVPISKCKARLCFVRYLETKHTVTVLPEKPVALVCRK